MSTDDHPRSDDRVWHAALRAVPRRPPPPGLTSRLVATSRAAWPAPAAPAVPPRIQAEGAVTIGVLTGAALLTLAPVAAVLVLVLIGPGVIVGSVARLFVLTVDWLSTGLTLWDVLGRFARIVGAAIASPTGTVVMVAGFLTASLALAGLSRLLPGERGEL
jgi:hypothetical protein